MPKIRGIFDHAKPRIISSYNSRAAPSPHTLTRASAPPRLAQPARRVRSRARRTSRRRLAASAPSLPTSSRVPATRLHKRLAPEMHKGRP